MKVTVTGTSIVSEGFATKNGVFSDGSSYAGSLSSYDGLRAPSASELATLSAALVRGTDALASQFFPDGNYSIKVYVYDGEKGLAAAHNSTANALAAGAPKNSIWIGFDTVDLNRVSKSVLLEAYAAHEVLHSSPMIDKQASGWASTFNKVEVSKIAGSLGISSERMKSLLKDALEHKIIGEVTEEAYSKFLGEKASLGYIISSLEGARKFSSLSKKDFNDALAEIAAEIDSLSLPRHCFPGATPILTGDGSTVRIDSLKVGDSVLSFDSSQSLGRGELIERRVARIFHSHTTEWIKLTWNEGGQDREIFATPGHHFLDQFGHFPTIQEMVRAGKCTAVLASGALIEVRAERILFSAETATMFERAVTFRAVAGNVALQPIEMDAWATHNFEVEELHTYVAGGMRVHNTSGVLGAIGNIFSADFDRFVHDGFLDTVGDHVSNFLHDVGSAINGFLPAMGQALNDIFSGDAFRGPRDAGVGFDGYERVSTAYVSGSLTADRVYSSGKFEGQKYQPGGDYDKDGKLSSKDLAARNADLYEKFSKTAETAQEREYYARRAEDYKKQAEGGKTDAKSDKDKGGGSKSSKPVLLDLDGNGVKIAEFDKSTIFMDGGDGLKHRTAWAGTGDGVLFYDAGDDNQITEKREFVFTEWNPTAAGDLEALRSIWDTNGDGKLSAADAEFAKFKVMVTNADGSTTVMTLAQLGITEINLTANTVNIELPDGSVITGQTTFTRANGTTGTVANTTLTAEAAGYRVVETVAINFAGERVLTQTGYDKDGGVAFRVTSFTNPSGTASLRLYDDNGDGVTDRVVSSVEAADGSVTVTAISFSPGGAVVARTVTVTSANGLVTTTSADANGDLVNETVVTDTTALALNGSRTQTVDVNNGDGSNRTLTVTTVSDDGLVVSTQADMDGDNAFDRATSSTRVLNANGSVTETVQARAQNAALLSQVQTTVSDDGLVTTVRSDADGDGDFDLVTTQTTTLLNDGGRTEVSELRTDTGILRAKTTTTSTDDARNITRSTDVNGDGQ